MDFASNQEEQVTAMLADIGVASFKDLIRSIPDALYQEAPSEDDGISEYEGLCLMENLAAKNRALSFDQYIGAGAYEHHVPALIPAMCSRSEFLTAYTPYQPEASQGILQAMFEFQSAICAMTEMDVANASVYDAASACAESVLMALRMYRGKRNQVLVAGNLHPHHAQVVRHYLSGHDVDILEIPVLADCTLDFAFLKEACGENTAAILVQSPNFLGAFEDVKACTELAALCGAVSILSANPLSYGIFASAGELGVDIAVGDTQPFGLALNFGGPYAGYMACREKFVRQLPGRIVGETEDTEGRKGYVLTLQAREQHIRREKATSNICTSQTLATVASLIGMLWYGKHGIQNLALTNYQRTSYLKEALESIPGFLVANNTHFNEFVLNCPVPVDHLLKVCREKGIIAGLKLSDFISGKNHSLLIAVTETKSKEKLDCYVDAVMGAVA